MVLASPSFHFFMPLLDNLSLGVIFRLLNKLQKFNPLRILSDLQFEELLPMSSSAIAIFQAPHSVPALALLLCPVALSTEPPVRQSSLVSATLWANSGANSESLLINPVAVKPLR
eukprot:Gb_12997 [translate_table: standard]